MLYANDRPWIAILAGAAGGAAAWSFLLIPVAAGVVILVGFAYLWHNVTRRGSWPDRWW
jgi:CBS-domain-containing membrane protein